MRFYLRYANAPGHSDFSSSGSPLDAQLSLPGADPQALREFLLTAVVCVGLNNLPGALSPELAQLRDDARSPSRGTPTRRQRTALGVLPTWVSPALRRQAAKSGYANRFAAARVRVPWRSPPSGLAYFANAAPEDVDRPPALGEPLDRLASSLASLEDLAPHAPGSSTLQPIGAAASAWRDDWALLIPASAVPLVCVR